MTVYLILLLLLLYLSQNAYVIPKAEWIGLLLIILVAGLRSKYVGVDLETYVDYFNGTTQLKVENGFELYMNIVRLITNSDQLFIAITAALTLFPVFLFFQRVSINPAQSLLIYFLLGSTGLFFTFTGLRQSIAIAFLMWVFYFFYVKRLVLSITFFIIAISFHLSAIFAFPVLLLSYAKINRVHGIILLILTALIGFSGGLGLDVFFGLFNSLDIFTYTNLENVNKYNIYLNYEADLQRNIFGLFSIIIPNTALAIYIYLKGIDNSFTRIFVIGVLITNLLANHPIVSRYTLPFTLLFTVIFPLSRNIIPYKMSDVVFHKGMFIYLILFFIYYHFNLQSQTITGDNNVVPYQFFFLNE